MAAYLIDHPPARSQFRKPRREKPSGVIAVHTAENTPDYVAFDGGAEAVARFIQSRTTPGSYHDLVDSDSSINVVPYEWEAFHDGTGTNPHSYGLSFATRADVWPVAPKAWRDGAIEQGAQAAWRFSRWIKAIHGVTIPAVRITADEARRRVPGFVTHAQLDPGRRTDPGKDFPWGQFLARYAALMGASSAPAPVPPPRKDHTMSIINIKGSPYNFLHLGGREFLPLDEAGFWRHAGAGIPVYVLSNDDFQGPKGMLAGKAYG